MLARTYLREKYLIVHLEDVIILTERFHITTFEEESHGQIVTFVSRVINDGPRCPTLPLILHYIYYVLHDRFGVVFKPENDLKMNYFSLSLLGLALGWQLLLKHKQADEWWER
jgi:hypothetical protein